MSKPFNALERDCTPERCTCQQRARGIRRGVLLSMEAIRRYMMWPEEREDGSIPPMDSIVTMLAYGTGPANLDLTNYAQYQHAIRWMLRKEAQRAQNRPADAETAL
jgi:hypothetical protein